ncbi:helix-turn-helix transcriptional regulator [Microbacterium sp. SORGH_AS_0888]|uniref:helix-turn-helix transcriptional regulator n=1 Tax=Microbacterium sp. SORGH_AS_0888 TaxID=3041791 RepID=UPI0027D88DD5|nr:helix-turn-helix transcriptional regulator [Microbacterium sp. SORGH_AS_0888]
MVVVSARGIGRSRLLDAVFSSLADPALLLRPDMLRGFSLKGNGAFPVGPLEATDPVASIIRDDTRVRVLAIDDADGVPPSTLQESIEAARYAGLTVIATAPSPLVPESVFGPWRCVLPSVLDGAAPTLISLEPLGLAATTAMAASVRSRQNDGTGPGDDAWSLALHRLSGGSPALIHELVGIAELNTDVDALMPLDLRLDALSPRLIEISHAMLAPLTAAQRCVVAVLGELGPVPASYLHQLIGAEDVARIKACGLLSPSTDPGVVHTSEVVAHVARANADEEALGLTRAIVAERLIAVRAQGARLSPVLTAFCARRARRLDIESFRSAIPDAMLTLARSSQPAEAIRVAQALTTEERDVRAVTALVMAHHAIGRPEKAEEAFRDMPSPRDRAEADLVIEASMTHLLSLESGGDRARAHLTEISERFADDASLQERIDGGFRVFSRIGGQPGVLSPPEQDGVSEETRALRDAADALIAALSGQGTAALRLLEPRASTHGLEIEPETDIFLRHAFVHVLLGHQTSQVRRATRRRLLAARWEDRQDVLRDLALLYATLHAMDGSGRGVFATLGLLDVVPHETTRIWFDVLRAGAYAQTGDLLHCSSLLSQLDRVPAPWARGLFGVTRALVRAVFNERDGRPKDAVDAVTSVLPDAESHAPFLLPTLLRVAWQAGMPTPEVLARASGYESRLDLTSLTKLMADLRSALDGKAPLALASLTRREREIVLMVMSGMSNAAIAGRLHLSIRTVESHLHHARTRLGMERSQRF